MKTLLPAGTLVLAALIACPCAGAQNAEVDPQTAALMKKAEELERGLAELKAELARRGALETSPAGGPQVAQALPETMAALPPANDGHVLGPLQLRGFSDLGFGRALFEKM